MIEIKKNGQWIEGEPSEGEVCRRVTKTELGLIYEEFLFCADPEIDLTILKAEKITEIKAEAERRIKLLDWRLERAKERETLGITGEETLIELYRLKENIRQWSNEQETILMDTNTHELAASFVFPNS